MGKYLVHYKERSIKDLTPFLNFTNSHTGDIIRVMSRPWRVEFRGVLYHVLSSGNEQVDLFLDDEDRNDFINLMGEIPNPFDVDVFA